MVSLRGELSLAVESTKPVDKSFVEPGSRAGWCGISEGLDSGVFSGFL